MRAEGIWLRFLSGPDIESLGISRAEIVDAVAGVPLAIIDATFITAARTGAMTAVGARVLARPDARVLGHAGARGTAFWT